MRWWLIGLVVFVGLFFGVVPVEKVDNWVREPGDPNASAWAPLPKGLYMKRGLRMAIEGRLQWLAIY